MYKLINTSTRSIVRPKWIRNKLHLNTLRNSLPGSFLGSGVHEARVRSVKLTNSHQSFFNMCVDNGPGRILATAHDQTDHNCAAVDHVYVRVRKHEQKRLQPSFRLKNLRRQFFTLQSFKYTSVSDRCRFVNFISGYDKKFGSLLNSSWREQFGELFFYENTPEEVKPSLYSVFATAGTPLNMPSTQL